MIYNIFYAHVLLIVMLLQQGSTLSVGVKTISTEGTIQGHQITIILIYSKKPLQTKEVALVNDHRIYHNFLG